MSFTEPVTGLLDNPLLPRIQPDRGYEPIYSRLPQNTQALINKYSELAPALPQIDPVAVRAVTSLDVDRVQRGASPLTRQQTIKALVAAANKATVTKPSDRNPWSFISNAVHDVRNLVASIPRIPGALVEELQDLPSIGTKISEAEAAGANPITALAQAPGIRMIPGAYVVGNVAKGPSGLKELATHPVFTALDVMPYANKLAEATKIGTAAKALEEPIHPIRALATRKLNAAGELTPNIIGRNVTEPFLRTKPGQLAQETWGKASRLLSREQNQKNAWLGIVKDPSKPLPTELWDHTPLDHRQFRMVQAVRDVSEIESKYQMKEWEPARLAHVTEKIQLNDVSGFTPDELAFTQDYRDLNIRLKKEFIDEGWLVEHGGEVFATAEGLPLFNAKRRLERTTVLRDINNQIINPTGDIDPILQQIRDTINAPLATRGQGQYGKPSTATMVQQHAAGELSRSAKKLHVRGLIHALDANGFDTRPLARVFNKHYVDGPEVAQALDDFDSMRPVRDPVTAPHTPGELKRRASYQRKLATDAHVNRAQKTLTRLEETTLPSRFRPLVEQEVKRQLIAKYASGPDAALVTDLINKDRYVLVPGWDPAMRANIYDDVAKTWQELRDAGLDPEYVHRISPQQAYWTAAPKAGEVPRSVSSVKARTSDWSPGIQDATLSMKHQAMEYLAKRASEHFIDNVLDRWGMTREDLVREYAADADAGFARDPRFPVQDRLEHLIARDFTPFNPEKEGFNWPREKLDRLARGEQFYLPKYLAQNMQRMANPKLSRVGQVLDPALRTFRTSVLALSPRWHAYNIGGGGVMLTAQTGPSVWKYLNTAIKMVKEGTLPQGMRITMGGEAGALKELDYLSEMSRKHADVAGARTLGRIYTEAVEHRLSQKLGAGFKKVTNASYEFNGFVDDVYRTMAFLYGYEKKIAGGVSKDVATKAGIEMTRKVLQSWTDMTPIERSILRYVMPFYGFAQHIIRFSLTYPFDHPIRAAVMGSIARAELEDLDGLPERFLSTMFFGKPGKDGMQRGFNVGGFNPFQSVPSFFTFAGFASQMNPAITTALEQLGIRDGSVELYPTLRYDPETGKMAYSAPNPITGLIYNTIPQAQIVGALVGVNKDFARLLRTNPEAAYRQLLSQGGLPVPFRTVNPTQEVAKNEITLQQAERQALNEALASGDDSAAVRFPGLRPILEKVREMQRRGLLTQYQGMEQQGLQLGPGQSNLASQSGGI